ncbi:disease resistance protein RPV1 [Cryptomeria japonica]|uniref:disease resistance protein RPV1 n=1 Tax=Cryptomeria japonica TaxID=3369 RepID=UPI0027D9FECF|nr:disease resistance protein RPV1 [Cryptomeria japonica]
MLESNAKIIPVFYQVEPWELRHIEKGVYADAFNKYEEKGRYLEKLKEWKEALQSVSFTTGYQFSNSEGWKQIVLAVQRGIQRAKSLHVAKYPVGLPKLVQDFERGCLEGLVRDFESQCRMSNESEGKAQIVGIFGMGGVGKTTLSKELFNKRRSKYHRASFLFDLQEASSRGELPSLQAKLLKDLFNEDHSNFPSVEDGTSCIKDCIEKSNILSVLIVLDDVDHTEQIDALLIKEMLNKSVNSLVIVTTRDVGVLISAGIMIGYNLKVMDTDDARELFSWHAFGKPHPDLEYKVLVDAFLDVCRGLPLSLQVLGRHVCGRTQHYWRLELNKVHKTLPRDILQKLKISIEALDYEEKQIFMDIACFFVEQRKSMAIAVWEGSGWSAQHALETLKSKCLVEEIQQSGWNAYKWKEVEILRMHDHLRDLGREMADELNHPSRLWHPQELQSLESKGFQYILAESKGRCFNSIFDMSMRSQITYFLGESDRGAERSTSLLWLQLDMTSSEECDDIPAWIPLQNLQCLRISKGYLKRLCQSNVQVPSRLKELQICQTVLEQFPDFLGVSNNLETVVLDAEHMQIEAWSLLQRLRVNLHSLDIRSSRLKGMLTSNDDEKQSTFKSLFIRDFNLSSELVLNNQWLTSTGLSGLENLQIGSQKFVTKILLTGICCPNLKFLKIYDIENLIEMDLRGTWTLNFLEITNCENFKRLLIASDVTNLVVVNISHCPELEESNLNVSCLAKMTIKNCWKKVARIGEGGNLVELKISECSRLQEFGFAPLSSLELQLIIVNN